MPQAKLVISIGIAGALSPELRLFDRAIIDRSINGATSEPAALVPALERLNAAANAIPRMSLVTVPRVVLSASDKSQLAASSGAALCDMETFEIAKACWERGLPWLGARLVSDTAGESMPQWLPLLPKLMATRRWWAMGQLIATHPQHLPGLIRLGIRMRRLQPELTRFTTDLISHVLPL